MSKRMKCSSIQSQKVSGGLETERDAFEPGKAKHEVVHREMIEGADRCGSGKKAQDKKELEVMYSEMVDRSENEAKA
jgi:hypothetical protein